MKTIDTKQMSPSQQKEACGEAKILAQINCEYVCKYFDSYFSGANIVIIMEYCENGDLGKYLKKQMGRSL